MATRQRIATLQELQQKQTIKFSYRQEGIQREAFLVFINGEVRCYENVCRHIPISLDFGDGRFLNPAGTHVICQTHGATYDPLSGECVAGPCVGAFLKKLPIELSDEEIWFTTDG